MKGIILLFLLSFVLTSCDQNGIAIQNAVGNFFTSPFKGIRDSIYEKQYNSLEVDTEKNSQEVLSARSCNGVISGMDPAVNAAAGLSKRLSGKVCECRPWGNCIASLCACEMLCPNDLRIFKRDEPKEIKDYSKKENSLSFRNTWSMPTNYPMTQGYCWGHASVTSKFNRLGFFKPKAPSPRKDFNSKDPVKRKAAVRYYQKIIDDIVDNKATDIPGYKNLEELSSDPMLETYIGDKVADSWGERAMSFQGLSVGMGSSKMKKEDSAKFIEDVVKKIDNHQQPQIVFTQEGAKFMTHAVLVSHYIKNSKGETVLCLRDNHDSPTTNYKCNNKMYIASDGSIRYNSWGDIGKVVVAHNENPDTVIQQKSLVEKCKGEHCQKNSGEKPVSLRFVP